tara:strand:+ start:59 stop:169 length:111 start_codon:yes stop_codon:yes gene_type:complete
VVEVHQQLTQMATLIMVEEETLQFFQQLHQQVVEVV